MLSPTPFSQLACIFICILGSEAPTETTKTQRNGGERVGRTKNNSSSGGRKSQSSPTTTYSAPNPIQEETTARERGRPKGENLRKKKRDLPEQETKRKRNHSPVLLSSPPGAPHETAAGGVGCALCNEQLPIWSFFGNLLRLSCCGFFLSPISSISSPSRFGERCLSIPFNFLYLFFHDTDDPKDSLNTVSLFLSFFLQFSTIHGSVSIPNPSSRISPGSIPTYEKQNLFLHLRQENESVPFFFPLDCSGLATLPPATSATATPLPANLRSIRPTSEP